MGLALLQGVKNFKAEHCSLMYRLDVKIKLSNKNFVHY